MLNLPRLILGVAACLGLVGCITINGPFGGAPDNALHETRISGHGSAKILWLPIAGFISAHPSSHAFGLAHSPSTLTRVTRALDKAERDDCIKAVVLRIDSPGGTVAASDEIHHRIERYAAKTGVPVLASLGGVATSGAYYVAMSADQVVAEPTTITGSIGVIIFDVNASGLMHKLGLTNETVKSAANKDLLSPLSQPTDEQRAIVQNVVDSLYHRFVSVVEASRPHLDRARLDRITDGRIFAAHRAARLGLVDAIGHRDDVIAAARATAGVKNAEVIRYYEGKQAPDTLSAAASADARPASAGTTGLGALAAIGALNEGQPLYLWRGGTH